jgi:superfamily II DNA or RNA helicase
LIENNDVAYRPFSEGMEWVGAFEVETCLVIGRATELTARTLSANKLSSCREIPAEKYSNLLHQGMYLLMDRGIWHLLFVLEGLAVASSSEGRQSMSADHLGEAAYVRRDEWASANPLLSASTFEVGNLVTPRSHKGWGTVVRVSRGSNGHTIEVELNNRIESFHENDLTLVSGDYRDPRTWIKSQPVSRDEIALTLSWLKLDTPLTNTLYSFAATKTKFRPYQFVPVLKMLGNSKGRILIADEVGLGKTIEAGLIWTELDMRQRIRKALVVVPASLKNKWQIEMDLRFGRELKELKPADLREYISQLRQDKDPDLIGVISLESLRSASDVLKDLIEVRAQFDLVIVDEAHALRNRNSRSFDAGEMLANLSDDIIFLSATPLNLATDDLYNLLSLLDTDSFPDKSVFNQQLEPNEYLNKIARVVGDMSANGLESAREAVAFIPQTQFGSALSQRPDFQRLVDILTYAEELNPDDVSRIRRLCSELNTLGSVFTRTRKVDVPDAKAKREVEEVIVEWTPQERALYDAIYAHTMERALKKKMPIGFIMQMPLRQACSSLPVMQQKLALRESWELSEGDDSILEQDEFDESSVDLEDQAALSRIQILQQKINVDTKLDALKKRLRLAKNADLGQAMIFSFFRGTVEYLAKELSPEFRVGVLHGGIPVESREEVIGNFRKGLFDILIANQVGSEGLDFQFCNVLVNYDLPWNPMQVEQRIGRLDRFGQTHDKIFIFNMKTPDTIETEIFGRLYDRIGVFESSIGDLEPIMRETFKTLNSQLLDPNLTDEERKRKADDFQIQTANQRANIELLEKNKGALASTSFLEIQGMTEDGPTNGRYVGPKELEMLVTNLMERHGGSFTVQADGVLSIIGNPKLAALLNELPREQIRSQSARTRTAQQFSSERPLKATFDPHHPQIEDLELINSGHPLSVLATEELRQRRDTLVRFGAVSVPGLEKGKTYLASLNLIRSLGGLTSSHELWVDAINLKYNVEEPTVGNALLTALAAGHLEEFTGSSDHLLESAYEVLSSNVEDRLFSERRERTQENAALVEARIESYRTSISVKLKRAQDVLNNFYQNKPYSSVIPMWESIVRRHENDLSQVEFKFSGKDQLTISMEKVALVLISGAG